MRRIPRVLLRDRAENSIMQTVSVAVSAVLIAAGLVTAPSLINSGRDGAVAADLAQIATNQSFYFAARGGYATSLTQILSTTGTARAKFSLSSNRPISVRASGDSCWMAFGSSASGATLYASSANAQPRIVAASAGWPAAPAGLPAACAANWPAAPVAAMAGATTALATSATSDDEARLDALLASASFRDVNVPAYSKVLTHPVSGYSAATGYTTVAAWRRGGAPADTTAAIISDLHVAAIAATTSQLKVNYGDGSSWVDGGSAPLAASDPDSSQYWAVSTVQGRAANLYSSAGGASTTLAATPADPASFDVNGSIADLYGAGGSPTTYNQLGSCGAVTFAAAWPRVLTAAERALLQTYVDGLSSANPCGADAALPAPRITTSALTSATVGSSYTLTPAAVNAAANASWSVVDGGSAATRLPPGLTIRASDGRISGTPTAGGTYAVTLRVRVGGAGSDTTTLPLRVYSAPATVSVANAGAEDTSNPGGSWQRYFGPSAGFTTASPHGGASSWRIQTVGNNPEGIIAGANGGISIPANTRVTVSAWITGTAGVSWAVAGRTDPYAEGMNTQNITTSGLGSWQQVSVTYTTTAASTTSLYIQARQNTVRAGDVLQMDDITVSVQN